MLNYETLLSSYDDKLTLLQWLKKVEAALKDASAVSFKVNKKGNATLTFSIVFEDGSELESGEIVLQQGESVESAAIVNGHLILTLTNGDQLDAGQLLNGDLNVSGNLAVSGNIASNGKITGAEIVEDMTGYSASLADIEGYTFEGTYISAVKNGNKLTLVFATSITRTAADASANPTPVIFTIPAEIGAKIYRIGSWDSVDLKYLPFFASQSAAPVYKNVRLWKYSDTQLYLQVFFLNELTLDTPYYVRYEATFLLSDNMAA